MTGGDEVVFAGRQRQGSGDLAGRHQPGPAVQGGLVGGIRLPFVGGLGKTSAHSDGVAVVVDPRRQAGPFPEERLVRHLDGGLAGDRVVVGDDQAVGPVGLDDRRRDVGHLRDDGSSTEVVAVVAGRHQPGEETVHVVALLDGRRLVDVLSPTGQCPADAAQLVVGLRGHGRVLAPLEQLGQGELQQR